MECWFRTFSQWQDILNLFCFTETGITDSPAKHIDGILDDWKDIYKNTQYGLALCYNIPIWYLILQILILLLFCRHSTVITLLFFQIWCIIFMQNVAVNNLAFNRYITHIYLSWWYLDARVSENLLWKQSPK